MSRRYNLSLEIAGSPKADEPAVIAAALREMADRHEGNASVPDDGAVDLEVLERRKVKVAWRVRTQP